MASSADATNPFSVNQTAAAADTTNPFSINQINAPSTDIYATNPTVTQPPAPASTGNGTTALLSARGAFYQVSLAVDAASASKSFYDVYGLTINPDQVSPQSPVLLDGIRVRNSDIVSRVPCLNNYKVYYSFGQNFGDIAISGQVLLGPLGNVKSDGVNRLIDFFWKYRVSVYHAPIVCHIIDKAYYFYLEGLQIMEADKEFHILPFALVGTQIDITRAKSGLINPSTVALTDANLETGSLAAALSVIPPAIASTSTANTATAANTVSSNNAKSTIEEPALPVTSINDNDPSLFESTLSSPTVTPPAPITGMIHDPEAALASDRITGNRIGGDNDLLDGLYENARNSGDKAGMAEYGAALVKEYNARSYNQVYNK